MTYAGHVEKGAIVLDDPLALPDGVTVRIEVVMECAEASESEAESATDIAIRFPLRGIAYRYDDPLEPAVPEHEWAANS